jgi:hypothetical protein
MIRFENDFQNKPKNFIKKEKCYIPYYYLITILLYDDNNFPTSVLVKKKKNSMVNWE